MSNEEIDFKTPVADMTEADMAANYLKIRMANMKQAEADKQKTEQDNAKKLEYEKLEAEIYKGFGLK